MPVNANFGSLGNRLRVIPIGNLAGGGAIGTAAATVDLAPTFNVNQTTAGQALSLPNPTNTAAGLWVTVNNVGSQSFTLLGATVAAGAGVSAQWTGAAWSKLD
jgi:hypothetical protein